VVPGFRTSDADPELFFPIGNAGPALLQLDQAKQVCGAQSVRRAWSGPWPAARRPAYGEAPVSLISPARPDDGPGPDPVAASCGLWSIEFPWVDQFDPGSGEVIGVASRQRRFGSAADGRDLGVGHTDWPPERFPGAGDIGVP
jgi:hypothetical protein